MDWTRTTKPGFLACSATESGYATAGTAMRQSNAAPGSHRLRMIGTPSGVCNGSGIKEQACCPHDGPYRDYPLYSAQVSDSRGVAQAAVCKGESRTSRSVYESGQ